MVSTDKLSQNTQSGSKINVNLWPKFLRYIPRAVNLTQLKYGCVMTAILI